MLACFLTLFDTFRHVLTLFDTFRHANHYVFDLFCFLTRFDTNVHTSRTGDEVSKNSVKKCQIFFDTSSRDRIRTTARGAPLELPSLDFAFGEAALAADLITA